LINYLKSYSVFYRSLWRKWTVWCSKYAGEFTRIQIPPFFVVIFCQQNWQRHDLSRDNN